MQDFSLNKPDYSFLKLNRYEKFVKIPLLVAVATMMTCSFSACSDNDDPTPDTGTSETDAKFEAIAKQYLDHTVYVTYKNLADETEQLVKDLQALKSSKTDANVKSYLRNLP